MKKLVFSFALILCLQFLVGNLKGQGLISESLLPETEPSRLTNFYSSSVKLENGTKVFVDWDSNYKFDEFIFSYKLSENGIFKTISLKESELVLTLSQDPGVIYYQIEGKSTEIKSSLKTGTISTNLDENQIMVSNKLANYLEVYFTEIKDVDLIKYLDEIEVPLVEKLSFMQKYFAPNVKLKEPKDKSSLKSYYTINESNILQDVSSRKKLECNCSYIRSFGENLAVPGFQDENPNIVIPTAQHENIHDSGDKTHLIRLHAGAAKFVSLTQDEDSGGMTYQINNLNGGSNSAASGYLQSSVRVMLGCTGKNPNDWTTKIPEDCNCTKPVYLTYQYDSRIEARAASGGCWFYSRGAEADVEDAAVVFLHHRKANTLTALAANQHKAYASCSSSFNPDFFINILDFAVPISSFFLTPRPGTNITSSIPSTETIKALADALKKLIATPVRNVNGACKTVESGVNLVRGTAQSNLVPNEVITMHMFTNYYAFVRGYGCWESHARIANNYLLTSVVESGSLTKGPCCSDKFGNYILGSLGSSDTPGGTDIGTFNAPLSKSDCRNLVGFELGSYGSWYNLSTSTATGIVNIPDDFGMAHGYSCGFVDEAKIGKVITGQLKVPFAIYPNPVSDMLTIQLDDLIYDPTIIIQDINGKVVYYRAKLENTTILQVNTKDFPAGIYNVKILNDSQYQIKKLIKI
jgi:hypothetical protein